MINVFESEALYKASTPEENETTLSHVTGTNDVHVDPVMVLTKTPERGDIGVLDAEKKLRFITFDSFKLSALPEGWTVVAPVEWRRGRKVKMNRVLGNYKWAKYFLWNVTGFTADGAEHAFSFKVTVSNVAYTCSGNYSGTDIDEVAASMNEIVSVFDFGGQKYHVYVRDGKLILSHDTYASYLAVTATGVTVTAWVGSELAASTATARYNGAKTGEGSVINLDRALIYFRADLSSATYNPTSEVTSIARTYPVCLPAYLGTSANRKDGDIQLDYCSFLRAYYGEGEEGWIKHVKDCMALFPSTYGVFNSAVYGEGKKNTYLLAGQRAEDHDGNDDELYPAFDAVAAFDLGADGFRAGDWYIPKLGELVELKRGITYPAIYVKGTGSVNVAAKDADILSRAYDKANLTQLANNSNAWASTRYSTSSAWGFLGSYGVAVSYVFYLAFQAVASVLYELSDSEN